MSETTGKLMISNVTLQETLEIINMPYTQGAEQDEGFLTLLIEGLSDLDENSWNEVPDPIKLWYNDIAEQSLKAEKDPEFEVTLPPIILIGETAEVSELENVVDYTSLAEDVEEEAVAEPEETAPPVKAAQQTKPKPKEKKEPSDNPSATTRAHNAKRGITGAERVRELICEHYEISLDAVLETLYAEGIEFKRSSAQVVYNGTRSAIATILKQKEVKDRTGKVLVSARD